MNSRRKFIVQGSLATTALIAAKPFNILANAASPFNQLGYKGRFVLLHTAHMHSCSDAETIKYITSLKESNNAVILATAGNKINSNSRNLDYDVTPHTGEELFHFSNDYKIIKKGSVKTGVIVAAANDNNAIEKVKVLSEKLKNEKGCRIVICLSQLGYKNKSGADDMKLAAASTHLDIIIGGHPGNAPLHPMIAHNKVNAEVIIHSASSFESGFGKIEIEFDEAGNKRYINLTNKSAEKAA